MTLVADFLKNTDNIIFLADYKDRQETKRDFVVLVRQLYRTRQKQEQVLRRKRNQEILAALKK